MPRGAKRFEVSSLTIHFASSLVMELLLFSHSIPVPLSLHFISFVNSEVVCLFTVCPPLRSRGLGLCFLQHNENDTGARKKIPPRIFSPGLFLFLVHHHIIAIIIYIKFRSVYVFYHILAYLCDEILFQ